MVRILRIDSPLSGPHPSLRYIGFFTAGPEQSPAHLLHLCAKKESAWVMAKITITTSVAVKCGPGKKRSAAVGSPWGRCGAVKRPVITLALVAFCILLFLKLAEASASPIKLVVDGKWVYTDVSPVLVEGRVLVPLRGVFEAIGGHAEWIPSENAVLARKGARLAKLYIGSAVAYVR